MEKTGTTSIQKMASTNRALFVKSGYFYSRVMGRDNHVNLVAYARNDDTSDNQRKRALANTGLDLSDFRAKLERDFLEEASQQSGKTLVLSNEHLHSRLTTVEEKERLRELLKSVSGDVTIYMYIRRQDLVAVSLYGTRLLSGGVTKLGSAIPSIGDEVPYFYDYYRIYSEYCSVFGRSNVKIKVFDPPSLIGGDICLDFLDWLGIELVEDPVVPKRENESISLAAQHLMAKMNNMNPPFIDKVPNPRRGKIDKRLPRIAKGKGVQPLRDDAKQFYSHFRGANAALFRLLDKHGEGFSEDFSMYVDQGVDKKPSHDELLELCVDLFVDLVDEINSKDESIKKLKNRVKVLEASQ